MKTTPSPSDSITPGLEIVNQVGMSGKIATTIGEKELVTVMTMKVLTAFFSQI